MISNFFIDRPIFATVVSVVITLIGGIALYTLPIAQYPRITPPGVSISISYPGANAQVVADTVAAPIEQQVTGVPGMLYMSSQSANDGSYSLSVTFDVGVDLNTALVMVQNRVALAMPLLPTSVQNQGITIRKRTPDILMMINFISPDGRYDDIYLSNFAMINIKDELLRVEGVSDVTFMGQRDYSIRAWLDPQKLASRSMTAGDVAQAMRQQNVEAAPGQIGRPPTGRGQAFQLPIDTLGRLNDPEQFGNIIIKAGTQARRTGAGLPSLSTSPGVAATLQTPPPHLSASIVRLHDVAEVKMGAQNYNQSCTFDGKPSVGVNVYQLPGTNALDVADRIRAKMAELKKRFPDGVDYQIGYDTTPFIRESVADVVKTLLEATLLVGLVVLVFLQSWRSVLIPMVAVPVAIIGTFAVMAAVGFSLNNISLFGLVLAIGIVVDDAIVVVENVERWLTKGLSPRDAARKAMEEVTGPVIAVALVLCAVFVPCAFISGITGRFFRQFAVTIAVSTVFSAINSLTLSPALAVLLLRPHGTRRDPLTWLLDMTLGWFFRLFNWAFAAGTAGYSWMVGRLLRVSLLVLLAYGGLLVLTYWIFQKAPTGFVPQQDQGRLIAAIQLPDSASLERTKETMALTDKIVRGDKDKNGKVLDERFPGIPGVAHTITICGLSFVQQAASPNFGSLFIILEPFAKRQKPGLKDEAIMRKLRQEWAKHLKDGVAVVSGSSPIPGLSVAGGFKIMVEDKAGLGLSTLQNQTDKLVRKMKEGPGLTGVSTTFRSNTPQLFMDIDRTKAAALGVSLTDLNQTLQIYLGSQYVNSFNEFGRHWQVTAQADGAFRDRVEKINLLKVRNSAGQMVPLGTLVQVKEISGPIFVTRFNLSTAAPITGSLLPGVSSGEVIKPTEELAYESLPRSMKTEWTELMFMQIKEGNTTMYVFALAVMCVFLTLSALYESWTLPLAVILVVPLCVLCSVVGVLYTNTSVNIFVQIGLVVLVGLACKNSILIVEFAKQLHQEGKPVYEATQEASRLRLRPILMTSFAFILGVVPLVFASGAGAEMRRSLGTAVFSGMLGVTLFGILLTPVFFYVIQGFSETRLFASIVTQWIFSCVLGGVLGMVSGYLLGKLEAISLFWGTLVGGCVGVVIVIAVLGVQLKFRPKKK